MKNIKIFISYAKEDYEIANHLYADLQKNGFIAWMDTKDLLPGERWKDRINKEIKDCTFFIALFSKQSVTKRGYVQKELKLALDVLDEFPESHVFIIPVRLDDCKIIQNKLTELQWVDLFLSYEDGLSRIISTITPATISLKADRYYTPFVKKESTSDADETITISSLIRKSLSESKTSYYSFFAGRDATGKTSIVLNAAYAAKPICNTILIFDIYNGISGFEGTLDIPSFNRDLNQAVIEGKDIDESLVRIEEGLLFIQFDYKSDSYVQNQMKQKITKQLNEIFQNVNLILINYPAEFPLGENMFFPGSNKFILITTAYHKNLTSLYAVMKLIHIKYSINNFFLLLNMANNQNEANETFRQFNLVAERFLKCNIVYIGCIKKSKLFRWASQRNLGSKFSFIESNPDDEFSREMKTIVKKIINNGVTVDAINKSGDTPLMTAAKTSRYKIVELIKRFLN